jgi:hypothetical protein
MLIKNIIWLEEIIEKNIKKNNVQPEEIIEILNNKPIFRFVEKGHQFEENIYSALG